MANDNNNPEYTNPGGETLNERLRRAAAMARGEHPDVQPKRPESPEPRRVEPQPDQATPPRPQVPPMPQDPPRERKYDNIDEFRRSARQPEPVREPEMRQRPPMREPEPYRYEEPRQQRRPEEPRRSRFDMSGGNNGGKDRKNMVRWISILAVLLLLAVLAVVFMSISHSREAAEQKQQIEQLQLANEQIQLANEYDALNNEFAQYENQTSLLANDSIVQKYSAARAQVEKLLQELKNEKNKSAAQINKLKGEIATLKGILRNYVEQINALSQENQELRSENQQVKARNQQLSQNIQSVQESNKVLNERMTLAEKLNVTGVALTPLNKKGKKEKNVTKARQLMVTFTIPQNNSTPVGEKTIYLRITNPEGTFLGGGGSFSFEGASLEATARKAIEYAGDEIPGVTIYWDVNTTLTPGDYTVELFADNFRLASRKFTLKK